MSRTPFIAGNWKMNKTIAEAEAFIQALLPRVSTADGVDVAVCVPFTDLQAVVDSTRGSRVEVYAQNMHQAPHGRVHRRGLGADAHRARRPRRRARPLRAARVLQRDRSRALGEGPRRARRRPEADPLRRRDGGRARGRRHRAQAAPPGPGGPGEARQRPPGRRRHRLRADLGHRHRARGHARAGPGRDRLRPRAGGRPRPRPGASARGSSTEARSSPTTRRSCSRCPTWTARSSAAPSLEVADFVAIVEAARP